tara:strand:- start:194 stop:2242 length:2049 start_codon:yes stop_codon:yes gene_type:complete
MNIIDIQDQLKNFSEQQLISEMQMPTGSAPQFLVLGEIKRRKRVRDDFMKREAANQPTVAEESIAAAGVPQSGIMGMSEAMAPQAAVAEGGIGSIMPQSMRPQTMPAPTDDAIPMREGGVPLGIRQNNPGNIRPGAGFYGETGQGGGYATFGTEDEGLRALARLMATYDDEYGINTLRGFASRFAPRSDNKLSFDNYVSYLGSTLGLDPDEEFDLKARRADLIPAVVGFEQGRDYEDRYSDDQIARAITAAGTEDEAEIAEILAGGISPSVLDQVVDAAKSAGTAISDAVMPSATAATLGGETRDLGTPQEEFDRIQSEKQGTLEYLGGLLGIGDPEPYEMGGRSFDDVRKVPMSEDDDSVKEMGIFDYLTETRDERLARQQREDPAAFAERERQAIIKRATEMAKLPPAIRREEMNKLYDTNRELAMAVDELLPATTQGGGLKYELFPGANEPSITLESAQEQADAAEAANMADAVERLEAKPETIDPQTAFDVEALAQRDFADSLAEDQKKSDAEKPPEPAPKTDTEPPKSDPDKKPTVTQPTVQTGLAKEIADLQAKLEKDRETDKYLALAQAGLALMSSKEPTLLGAVGEAGVSGLQAFRDAQERYQEGVVDLINAKAKLQKTSDTNVLSRDVLLRESVSLFEAAQKPDVLPEDKDALLARAAQLRALAGIPDFSVVN